MSEPNTSDFGVVIDRLRHDGTSAYAYRIGWNGISAGRDMRLTIEQPMLESIPELKNVSRAFVLTTDGVAVVGWLASQTDMLATDWVIENG